VTGHYVTQNDRMLELLRKRPHNGLELRTEHGIGAPNSRRSDLEDRGHVVVCKRVPGVRGPKSYVYELLVDAEQGRASLEEPVGYASTGSSSDGSLDRQADPYGNGDRSAEGETMAPSAEPAEPQQLFDVEPPQKKPGDVLREYSA
jgi:hypothetical protein